MSTLNSTWYSKFVADVGPERAQRWGRRAISHRWLTSKTGKRYIGGQIGMLTSVWSEKLTVKQAKKYGFAKADGSVNSWAFYFAMTRCLLNQFASETGKLGSEQTKRGSISRLEADKLIASKAAPPAKYLQAVVDYRNSQGL